MQDIDRVYIVTLHPITSNQEANIIPNMGLLRLGLLSCRLGSINCHFHHALRWGCDDDMKVAISSKPSTLQLCICIIKP